MLHTSNQHQRHIIFLPFITFDHTGYLIPKQVVHLQLFKTYTNMWLIYAPSVVLKGA